MIDWRNKKLSNRGKQWSLFSQKVLEHIESYTVPQYGDKPDDQAESWTSADCAKAIDRYALRHGKNSRDKQDKLDFKKVAHYACLGHDKVEEKEKNEDPACIIIPEFESTHEKYSAKIKKSEVPFKDKPVPIGSLWLNHLIIAYVLFNAKTERVSVESLMLVKAEADYLDCLSDAMCHVSAATAKQK